ncbi:acyl-CoA dehydrogenase [Deltaproteobacteria bacterium TL4]
MSSTELTIDYQDIQFALNEWLQAGEKLNQFPQFQDFDTETINLLIKEGLDFAVQTIAPTASESDRIGVQIVNGRAIVPKCLEEPYRKAYQLGWANICVNPEYGGQGAPLLIGTALSEGMSGANVSLAGVFFLNEGAMGLVETFGTEEQKALYAPKMGSGEYTGTMCLSEPNAGSDVGAGTTTAERVGDGRYKIKGTKCWITNGDTNLGKNAIHAVLARIKGDPEGVKGLSLFIVPAFHVDPDGTIGKSNDVTLGSIEHKMGMLASPTCVLNFGENDNCYGYLLGKECGGIGHMFQLMNEARIATAVLGLGASSAAYQNALSYAKERVQGVHINKMRDATAEKVLIIEHPDVRLNLMNMKARVEAIRALIYATAQFLDLHTVATDENERKELDGLVGLLTPMCKGWASEVGLDVVRTGIQVLGGVGYTKDFPLEQLYRDLRVSTIYEGTTGIQALDLVGRKMMANNGQVFMGLLQRFAKMIEENQDHAVMGSAIKTWGGYCETVGDCAQLMQSMMSDRGLEGAVLYATPMLMYISAVTAGYFYLEQGLVAADQLGSLKKEQNIAESSVASFVKENSSAQFYDNKIKTIQFYMDVVMPSFESYAKALKSKNYNALDINL